MLPALREALSDLAAQYPRDALVRLCVPAAVAVASFIVWTWFAKMGAPL